MKFFSTLRFFFFVSLFLACAGNGWAQFQCNFSQEPKNLKASSTMGGAAKTTFTRCETIYLYWDKVGYGSMYCGPNQTVRQYNAEPAYRITLSKCTGGTCFQGACSQNAFGTNYVANTVFCPNHTKTDQDLYPENTCDPIGQCGSTYPGCSSQQDACNSTATPAARIAVIYPGELQAGTYYWTVRAGICCGNSKWASVMSFTITDCPCSSPAAPTGFSASASGTTVNFSWNSVANATSYSIYQTNGTLVGTTTSTSYSKSAYACGTAYTFYVKANNNCGPSPASNFASATTSSCSDGGGDCTAPTAPTLSLISCGSNTMTVSWTNTGADEYDIYRNGLFYTYTTGTTATIDLSGNTTVYIRPYKYCIGYGSNSNSVSCSPPPPCPQIYNSQLSVTASANSICKGQTVNFTGTKPSHAVTWYWKTSLSGAKLNVNSTNYTQTFPNAGTFTVYFYAEDCMGNVVYRSATITVNNPPAIVATYDDPACTAGGVSLTATGAVIYTWSPEDYLSDVSSNLVTFSGPAGSYVYTVTGVSANGCTATAAVSFTVKESPAIMASSSVDTVCAGGCATLTASGAATYVWQPGNLSGASVSVCPSSATTYTVTGTAANGCTQTATVQVATQIVQATLAPAFITAGQNSILTASGAISYLWQPGGMAGASVSVSPTVTTVYTVTGTHAGGCTTTATATVTVFVDNPCINMKPHKVWDKTLGGDLDEQGYVIIESGDGGFILAGSSVSNISGDKTQSRIGSLDYWIVKIDANGNKIWDKTYGGTGNDHATSIAVSLDGGFVVAGVSNSGIGGNKTEGNKGQYDYWLVKIDANGNKIWDKTYGGNFFDRASSIIASNDGGFIVVGYTASVAGGDVTDASRGSWDYWILKIDGNGSKVWDKRFGGIGTDDALSISLSGDGGYVIAGNSDSGIDGDKTENCRGGRDYWILKIDENGNKVWDKRFGGTNPDYAFSIVLSGDGGYVVAGYSGSQNNGDKTETTRGLNDYWLVKMDANGNKVWDKRFGGVGSDYAFSIVLSGDGGYVVAGYSESQNNGDKTELSRGGYDYWLVKVDANGNKVWDKRFGGTGTDFVGFDVVGFTFGFGTGWGSGGLLSKGNGRYIVAGSSNSVVSGDKTEISRGDFDYWILSLASDLPISISGNTALCAGNCATLSATGAVNYSWQPAAGLDTTAGGVVIACPTVSTTYTVSGDSAGCIGTATITVTVSSNMPAFTATPTNPTCYGQTNGAINVTVTNPASNFTVTLNGANPFSASHNYTNLSAGVYVVKVVDNAGGCETTDTLTLTQPDSLVLSATKTEISCIGAADGKIAAHASGGTPPYEFSLNGAPYGPDSVFAPLAPGTYSLSVKDANGCVVNYETSNNLTAGLVGYWPFDGNANDMSGNGNHGQIIGNVTQAAGVGGIPGTAYYFGGHSNGNDFINVPHNPVLNPQGSATIALWMNHPEITGNTYNAFFIVSKGRDISNSYQITGNRGNASLSFEIEPANCGLENVDELNTWIHLVARVDVATQKGMLFKNGVKICEVNTTGANVVTTDPLHFGKHSNFYGGFSYPYKGVLDDLRMYDRALSDAEIMQLYTGVGGGFLFSDPLVNDPLAGVSISATDTTICTGGVTNLTASGANAYSWAPFPVAVTGADVQVSPTVTTTYTVTGTGANGCTGTAALTVVVTPPPAVTLSTLGSTVCPGANGTLSVLNTQIGLGYQLVDAAGTGIGNAVAGNGATVALSVPSGLLSVGANAIGVRAFSDSTGCAVSGSSVDTVFVTAPPAPVITGSTTVCGTNKTILTVSNGNFATANWSTGAVGLTTLAGVGTYTVTVVDTLTGCTAVSAPFTVKDSAVVSPIPVLASAFNICQFQSAALQASATGTVSWQPGNLSGHSITVSPMVTTTYTVSSIDGSCLGLDSITITVAPNVQVVAAAGRDSLCFGDSTELSASGAVDYLWLPNGVLGANVTVTPEETTTYTVIGSTANGCTSTAMVNINVGKNLDLVTALASKTRVCASDSVTLTASGADSYVWQPVGLSGAAVKVSVDSTTTYSVTATDAVGCATTRQVTVQAFEFPLAVTVSQTAACPANTFVLTATGAATYTWSPAAGLNATTGSSVIATPSVPTTYTVTGTLNGCVETAKVVVSP